MASKVKTGWPASIRRCAASSMVPAATRVGGQSPFPTFWLPSLSVVDRANVLEGVVSTIAEKGGVDYKAWFLRQNMSV
jgi:hypothetical protein